MSSSFNRTLLAPQYVTGLRKLGLTVHEIDHRVLDHKIAANNISRIVGKFSRSRQYRLYSDELVKQVKTVKPDVCVIFKGMNYKPESLHDIKNTGALLVNLNPDHPTQFGPNQGNSNVISSIGMYDHYITFSQFIKDELAIRYPKLPCTVIPFGYSLSKVEFDSLSQTTEICRACFVGMADRHRARILRYLSSTDSNIDVYGTGWSRFKLHLGNNINIFDTVSGVDFWRTLKTYRIQLNLLRAQNRNMHNMRSFEIPGAGGIMLAPQTTEHELYFRNEEHIFLYKNLDEAKGKIPILLEMGKEKSQAIRNAARQHSENSFYHYRYRSKLLAAVLKELCQPAPQSTP